MNEIGFRSKKEMINALDVGDLRRKVTPTLELSKEALETPLTNPCLEGIREFLTRTGKWEGHPVLSAELFVCVPAPGVIVSKSAPRVIGDIDEPVFRSLGFGDITYASEYAHCSMHACDIYDSQCLEHNSREDCRGYCTKQGCNKMNCDGHYCDKENCANVNCKKETCGSQSCADQKFSSLLEAYMDHPFVRELSRYFDINVPDRLAEAVMRFVGKNMFDASAL